MLPRIERLISYIGLLVLACMPRVTASGNKIEWNQAERMLATTATIQKVEIAFLIEDGRPLPFARDIRASIQNPTGDVRVVPAFYDGDRTWRVRYLPSAIGMHKVIRISECNEGTSETLRVYPLANFEFPVSSLSRRAMIRVCPENPRQFQFESGEPYFPLGHNFAWAGVDEYPTTFGKMKAAGENWSRVWMAHWAGLNIDWEMNRPLEHGELALDVIRRWDEIVEAAEENGIYIQLVLQQHGQYSTFVNPIWAENPWNRVQGGFLDRPEQFFSDPEARRLCKIKYRYAIARWGYSPAIMAWELFNEIEYTNAYVLEYMENAAEVLALDTLIPALAKRETGVVAAWHAEMAEYIRSVDPYHHLITTSSPPVHSPIWKAMDYYQLHCYQPDMVSALSAFPDGIPTDKPLFYAEMGDHRMESDLKEDGRYMPPMMWAGLMAGGSGAAQVWDWHKVERADLYAQYRSMGAFIKLARMAELVFSPASLLITLSPGTAASDKPASLLGFGARSGDEAIAWLYNRNATARTPGMPLRGKLTLHDFPLGLYDIIWWDTALGCPSRVEKRAHAEVGDFSLDTPEITQDVALIIRSAK